MHHFIYPSQDTYLTNRSNELDTKNFGVDEILQVGTQNRFAAYVSPTKDYIYVNEVFDHVGVQFFNGQFTGSILGDVSSSAILNGAPFPGPFLVMGFMGTISSGSYICLYGTASGVDTRQEKIRLYKSQSYTDRALIQFNLDAISASIVDGTIISASFHLKVKICDEYQLPIDYSIYAYPVTESWVMGNGYMSDGGSDDGVSWVYRDFNGGTQWGIPGGTYGLPVCTQSFHYKSADIDMDVTPIVNSWLAGAPNNGFLLISSDELFPTGSGFMLKYFSEDTNTIYSPVLDVKWSDWSFVTGSFLTSSVIISVMSGSTLEVNTSGSWFNGIGGVHGNFTASTDLWFGTHYITSSGDMTAFYNELVQQFTGSLTGSFYGIAEVSYGEFSGSGNFFADYFSGSIDGIPVEFTGEVNGNLIDVFVSGTVIMPTSSIYLFTGYMKSPAISLTGTGSGKYYDSASYSFNGFVMGQGISGNIAGVPIFGPAFGVMSATTTVVTLPTEWHFSYPTSPNESPYGDMIRQIFNCGPNCGTSPCNSRPNPWNYAPPPNSQFCNPTPYAFDSLYYIWGGDDVGWRTTLPEASSSVLTSSCGKFHTVQRMSGTFNGGMFSGSSFFAFYENYRISFGVLTGSWNPWALQGETLIVNFPAVYDNYYIAYLYGPFVFGPLLGVYTVSASANQSMTSASFIGQFTDGMFMGGTVNLKLTGSVLTSSIAYTSSVQITSSFLDPLDTGRQFSINLQNLQPTYKAGDIVKINVFGRPKFPIKDFAILTQQQAYLVPNFLPTSSYWALKDNQTDEIVVNFDNYTQISCEFPNGNFFLVDTTSLPQERYYRILIRIDDGVQVDTIDTGKTFKITR